MALLALDDTDTRAGGCTTHTAYQLAVALERHGGPLADWGLIGPPRLVRLCPAIREKTRGNGALVLPVGRVDPHDPGVMIGRSPAGADLVFRPEREAGPTSEAETAAFQQLVAAHLPDAVGGDHDPQPAALLLGSPADEALYTRAVARRVTSDEAWAAAPPGTRRLTPAWRRGEIGALAATAWRPAPEAMTWEAIGYRDPHQERVLPPGFAPALTTLRGGFDNVDTATGRIRSIPRTPCPVRFGVRGLDPEALRAFAWTTWCDPHGTGGWLLATNHARGDHLRYAATALGQERVVQIEVTVQGRPVRARGGHLFLDAVHHEAPVRLAVYEPTKSLRDAAARLALGDQIVVAGRTADDPGVLALERFKAHSFAPRKVLGPNPRCDPCEQAMKSRGNGAGFRCPSCHARRPETARSFVLKDPGLDIGVWYQVPDHVRGHLLPPLNGLPASLPLNGKPRPRLSPRA